LTSTGTKIEGTKQATIAEWTKALDANGDGRMSWKEFVTASTGLVDGSLVNHPH